MCLAKFSPFTRMFLGALAGVVLGIIFGLLFGLLIALISQQFSARGFDGPGSEYGLAAFLGMGFGAIVGSILGATSANKKE